ncbi:HDOD domain-containing protein [Thauera mechernichensis]|uniref:HDOD domain-containing protein n=1 Tax=Thauera sp. 27 TaxID=305700 RepID=UPI0002D026F1|nr:HDOD domain-containing protein [Thauera sp. 27]ENO78020.1 hypothetical protein B447_14944 [Thauera sp. 27]
MIAFEEQLAAFTETIERDLGRGALTFPTVFSLSLRVMKLSEDPSVSIEEIARLVRTDPVLSAKVLRAANSVLLNPSQKEISSVSKALNRIGSTTFRCLIFAAAAEQVARDQRTKRMRVLASELWAHSVDVDSWCYATAKVLKICSPDTALMTGLMSKVGQFYLLAMASKFPALDDHLLKFAHFVSLWEGPVRQSMLQAFELPTVIVEAINAGHDRPMVATQPASLAEVLTFAEHAAQTANPLTRLLGVEQTRVPTAQLSEANGAKSFEAIVRAATATRDEILTLLAGHK